MRVSTIAPSPALRRMIEKRIDSFEKLEIALALREAKDGLSIEQLARELQTGTDVLRRLVVALVATQVVDQPQLDLVRLALTASELEVLDEAARLYLDDRERLVGLFSSIALDRIRGMAARSFADAFKLRKKDDSDG